MMSNFYEGEGYIYIEPIPGTLPSTLPSTLGYPPILS